MGRRWDFFGGRAICSCSPAGGPSYWRLKLGASQKLVVGLFGAFVALMLTPVPGLAQAPALSAEEQGAFADIDVRLGDTLIVETWDGPRLKGVLRSLGSEQLTLDVKGNPVTLAAVDVREVKRQRLSVLLGTIVGAGAGLGVGLAGGNSDYLNESGFALTATLVGAGIGFAIDALINVPRTVYRREVRVSVAPILDDQAVGVSVRLGF